RPRLSRYRLEVGVGCSDKRFEVEAIVPREKWPQVVRSAAPLVDGAAPVVARVMKATGRHLDQALVETRVGTFSVGHPFALPRFVSLPVAAAVKKLDPLPQQLGHARAHDRVNAIIASWMRRVPNIRGSISPAIPSTDTFAS